MKLEVPLGATVPRVLTVAGSDSGGGAGIQADLKTLALLGVHPLTVLTAVTAQNSQGVQGVYTLPVDIVEQQLDSVLSDIVLDSAKTGMLSSSAVIKAVAGRIASSAVKYLVVDPVFKAESGLSLIQEGALHTMRVELLPLVYVITPNLHEASILSDRTVTSVEDMQRAARIIYTLGPRNVIITGGHLETHATDVLYDGSEFTLFGGPKITGAAVHGTGCVFSAAIAAFLAKGLSVKDAAKEAKKTVRSAIERAYRIGKGSPVANQLARIDP